MGPPLGRSHPREARRALAARGVVGRGGGVSRQNVCPGFVTINQMMTASPTTPIAVITCAVDERIS